MFTVSTCSLQLSTVSIIVSKNFSVVALRLIIVINCELIQCYNVQWYKRCLKIDLFTYGSPSVHNLYCHLVTAGISKLVVIAAIVHLTNVCFSISIIML